MSPSAFPIVAVREICNTRDGRDSLPQNIELFSLHLDPGVQGNAGEVAFGWQCCAQIQQLRMGSSQHADACFTNSDIS